MQSDPDPADVDVSGRGETQPASEDAAKRFAEQTERTETHNEPARGSAALHGPAAHDESSEATVGRSRGSGETTTTQTDEADNDHPPQPKQPRPD